MLVWSRRPMYYLYLSPCREDKYEMAMKIVLLSKRKMISNHYSFASVNRNQEKQLSIMLLLRETWLFMWLWKYGRRDYQRSVSWSIKSPVGFQGLREKLPASHTFQWCTKAHHCHIIKATLPVLEPQHLACPQASTWPQLACGFHVAWGPLTRMATLALIFTAPYPLTFWFAW